MSYQIDYIPLKTQLSAQMDICGCSNGNGNVDSKAYSGNIITY